MKKIFLKFKWEIKRCDNKMTIFFPKKYVKHIKTVHKRTGNCDKYIYVQINKLLRTGV